MIPPSRRPIAGMQAPQASRASMQMAAQRQALSGGTTGITPDAVASIGSTGVTTPLFGGGKQGLVNYGGAVGANAEALRALQPGHVL